jgi:hypothetical protein
MKLNQQTKQNGSVLNIKSHLRIAVIFNTHDNKTKHKQNKNKNTNSK